MRIFKHIDEIQFDKNTVLTIGTFDGVHLGHQEILKKLFERTRFHKGRSFLVTFHPHPRKIVSKANDLKVLTTPDEKAFILDKMGLENLFILNFTKEFSQNSPEEFFRNFIIDKIGLKEIVVGHDHKFGKGRQGTSDTLMKLGKEFGFSVTLVDEFKVNDETISSTKLRQAITVGDILKTNKYLGRYYSFSGEVVAGDKRGRELGYPTANVKLNDGDKLLPGLGIYAAEVVIGNEKYGALLSIGRRPTFYDNGAIVPEVYIYNFNKDIYGHNIKTSVLQKIRDEEKFSSPEDLIAQMDKDKKAGIKILNEINHIENLSKFKG